MNALNRNLKGYVVGIFGGKYARIFPGCNLRVTGGDGSRANAKGEILYGQWVDNDGVNITKFLPATVEGWMVKKVLYKWPKSLPVKKRHSRYRIATAPDVIALNSELSGVYVPDGWIRRPRFHRVVFIRDKFMCQHCGLAPRSVNKDGQDTPDMKALAVDHIQPILKGGTSEVKNLQLLCYPCHTQKGTTFTHGKGAIS